MPTLASDARAACTLYSDRDTLLDAAGCLATLSRQHAGQHVCPVPQCTRSADHPSRLDAHLLADHFDLVKAHAAVLARLADFCEEHQTCPLDQHHAPQGQGDWREHLAMEHMHDAWAIAQKLQRSYSYDALPFSTHPNPCPSKFCPQTRPQSAAVPATTASARIPAPNHLLYLSPRQHMSDTQADTDHHHDVSKPASVASTPGKLSIASKVPSTMSKVASTVRVRDMQYPCPLGCAASAMPPWQVPGHVLDMHLDLLLKWAITDRRTRPQHNGPHFDAATPQPDAAQRSWTGLMTRLSARQGTAVPQANHRLAGTALSPPQPASRHSTTAGGVSPPQAGKPTTLSAEHAAQASTDEFPPSPVPILRVAIHRGAPPQSPTLQEPSFRLTAAPGAGGLGSSTTWLTHSMASRASSSQPCSPDVAVSQEAAVMAAEVSRCAAAMADVRGQVVEAVRQVNKTACMTDLEDTLQVVQPRLQELASSLSQLAVSPVAPTTRHANSTGSSPVAVLRGSNTLDKPFAARLLAVASSVQEASVSQQQLLCSSGPTPADLGGSCVLHGSGHVMAAAGSGQRGDWLREAAAQLQRQLGQQLRELMELAAEAARKVSPQRQRPGAAPLVASPAPQHPVAVAAEADRTLQVAKRAAARKPDVCCVGSWNLEGATWQGMRTPWLQTMVDSALHTQLSVLVLQRVPCQAVASALQLKLQEQDPTGDWNAQFIQSSQQATQDSSGGHAGSHAVLWRRCAEHAGCAEGPSVEPWTGTSQGAIQSLTHTHDLFTHSPTYALLSTGQHALLIISVVLPSDPDQAMSEVRRLPLLASAAALANPSLFSTSTTITTTQQPTQVLILAHANLDSQQASSAEREARSAAWARVESAGWRSVALGPTTLVPEPRQVDHILVRQGALPPGCQAGVYTPAAAAQPRHRLLWVECWVPDRHAGSSPQRGQTTTKAAMPEFHTPDLVLACQPEVQHGAPAVCADPAVLAVANLQHSTHQHPIPAATAQGRHGPRAGALPGVSGSSAVPDTRSQPPVDPLSMSWEEQVLMVASRSNTPTRSPTADMQHISSPAGTPTMSSAARGTPVFAAHTPPSAHASPTAAHAPGASVSDYQPPDFLTLAEAYISIPGGPTADISPARLHTSSTPTTSPQAQSLGPLATAVGALGSPRVPAHSSPARSSVADLALPYPSDRGVDRLSAGQVTSPSRQSQPQAGWLSGSMDESDTQRLVTLAHQQQPGAATAPAPSSAVAGVTATPLQGPAHMVQQHRHEAVGEGETRPGLPQLLSSLSFSINTHASPTAATMSHPPTHPASSRAGSAQGPSRASSFNSPAAAAAAAALARQASIQSMGSADVVTGTRTPSVASAAGAHVASSAGALSTAAGVAHTGMPLGDQDVVGSLSAGASSTGTGSGRSSTGGGEGFVGVPQAPQRQLAIQVAHSTPGSLGGTPGLSEDGGSTFLTPKTSTTGAAQPATAQLLSPMTQLMHQVVLGTLGDDSLTSSSASESVSVSDSLDLPGNEAPPKATAQPATAQGHSATGQSAAREQPAAHAHTTASPNTQHSAAAQHAVAPAQHAIVAEVEADPGHSTVSGALDAYSESGLSDSGVSNDGCDSDAEDDALLRELLGEPALPAKRVSQAPPAAHAGPADSKPVASHESSSSFPEDLMGLVRGAGFDDDVESISPQDSFTGLFSEESKHANLRLAPQAAPKPPMVAGDVLMLSRDTSVKPRGAAAGATAKGAPSGWVQAPSQPSPQGSESQVQRVLGKPQHGSETGDSWADMLVDPDEFVNTLVNKRHGQGTASTTSTGGAGSPLRNTTGAGAVAPVSASTAETPTGSYGAHHHVSHNAEVLDLDEIEEFVAAGPVHKGGWVL